MEEICKPIPGYEGLYEASTLGRIRSAEGKTTSSARFPKRVWKQRVLKAKTQKRRGNKNLSDERVCLWKDGKEKTYLVSRLIAMTFCPLSYEHFTVNHINGNPMDNRPDNLEWVTLKENIRHGFNTGLYEGVKKPVYLFDEQYNKKRFDSMEDARKYIGKDGKYISNVIAKAHYACDNNGKRYVAILATD